MQVLKINNNHGYYIIEDVEHEIIDINKEDIFKILNSIFENDDITYDKDDKVSQILNDAERIIYTNVCEYIDNFIEQKESIKSEIDNEFSEIMNLLNDNNLGKE